MDIRGVDFCSIDLLIKTQPATGIYSVAVSATGSPRYMYISRSYTAMSASATIKFMGSSIAYVAV